MKRTTILILALIQISLFAQKEDYNDFDYLRSIGYKIAEQDEAMFESVPELKLPAEYEKIILPPVVDNSQYKFFRPIFSQTNYPNCMQSTSIAYNYTYEIDRSRDLSADLPENQYTTHFAWNFYNGGDGWYGVNYLHTFNILKKCGTPNVADYGGFYYGEGTRWMSGYNEYYNAMHNRIDKIYTVPLDSEIGILTLKHWLYHHFENAETGGVASFIACSPWNLSYLPAGTPEEFYPVMTEFYPEALHGMTIVGYNDSIRYDFNSDGDYTNHIDINGDGQINAQDWEIGGFKFANSYDTSWAHNGFAYLMYRTVAIPIEEGGIWSNAAHVITLSEPYEPEITLKVKMNHDSREMIKVTAGVTTDISSNMPSVMIDFPIFNYQGGDKYMQGNDSLESLKEIEFGLDITPLLSHCTPNIPAKFFLIINEQDPNNKGYGEMMSFSLMDYTSGITEIPYGASNVSLSNNGTSMFAVEANINFSKPDIITAELPAFTPGVSSEIELQATGGTPPYAWALKKKYFCSYDMASFPMIQTNELYPLNSNDSIYSIPLEFSFPYFGKKYDTIHACRNSYLYFEDEFVYWSYIKNHKEFLKDVQCISPLKAKEVELDLMNNDGLWYESTPDYIIFRWNATITDQLQSDVNMAVKLMKNGDIYFYYGDVMYEEYIDWAGGISEGNGFNYHFIDYLHASDIPYGTQIIFDYKRLPDSISIVNDNFLSIWNADDSEIFDLEILCTDSKGISDKESLQLSDGLLINFLVDAEGDTVIEYGENVKYDLIVKNISSQGLNDVVLNVQSNNQFIQLLDNNEMIGELAPGQEKSFVNALDLDISINVPDNYHIDLNAEIQSQAQNWSKEFISKVKAPSLSITQVEVDDSNGRLDPGETSDLIIPLYNAGHAESNPVNVEISTVNNLIQIIGQNSQDYGIIEPGNTNEKTYSVFVDYSVPNGYFVELAVRIFDSYGYERYDTLDFRVGRIPALILDLDPNNISGPAINETLARLGVNVNYLMAFPQNGLNNYQAIFVCLGVQFSSTELTWQQGVQLADYLNAGGKIYLEGREAWRDHLQTPMHDKFNINTFDLPAMYYNIIGIDSTFTQGVSMENIAAQPFSYYYLEPEPPAYVAFINESDSLCCGVAYEQGTYKTLGTVFEFGNLLNDSSRRDTLMKRIIDFFDIVLTVSDTEELNVTSPIIDLSCYPNPFSNSTRLSFNLNDDLDVFLEVFNIQGQKIHSIIDGVKMPEGANEVEWNIDDTTIPTGIYFVKLRANNNFKTTKLIIIK